jgi:hypothetical protein
MVYASNFLTNPIPCKVHDENNEQKFITLMFTKPFIREGTKVIGLLVFGNTTPTVLEQIEKDVIVGISYGHLVKVQEAQQEKQEKKDLKSFFIKSFLYQGYSYAYKDVIENATGIGIAIFQQSYLRQAIKEVADVAGIDWNEKKDNFLVKAKAEEYSSQEVIAYWVKDKKKEENWVIPGEAAKFWALVLTYSGDGAEELSGKLYKAFKKNDQKAIDAITFDMMKFMTEKDSQI